jgi:(1->4)-alpha-D-glucan 1-alpha-D-glucosylmutase
MERPEVFEATHRLLMQLLAEGSVTGLRIDHPDGLWDPAGYFRRLQERYAEILDQQRTTDDGQRTTNDGRAPRTENQPESTQPRTNQESMTNGELDSSSALLGRSSLGVRPLYIVAEKILGRGERLPDDWAVHGTTGYEFLNVLNGIFVDRTAEKSFTELYFAFIGQRMRLDDLIYDSKKQIMRIAMASEINVLAYQLNRISEHNRYYRDFTLNSLRDALRELIACFSVYRTYIVASTDHVEERDRAYIETAIAASKRRNPTVDPSIYEFLRDILLLRYPDTLEPEARDEQRTFVMKFQQITGPVMAKGIEDTAFYLYNRLASLNEVGGEPQRFGTLFAEFHRQNQERLRNWPASLLATSTHDTKRSEDIRARINVLSELPDEWRAALTRWSRLNRNKKIEVNGKLAPERNEEYLLYQTLLGAWPNQPLDSDTRPAFVERIQSYMIKAIREAKVNTSWLNPNTAYDEAVRGFVAAILNDAPTNRFLTDFQILQRKIAHFGAFNSLSQAVLKFAAPGVPDVYQGNEMWDWSLVDPDNRRPVDYDLRTWLLGELLDPPDDRATLARTLVDAKDDGRIKLYLTHRALTFRRDRAELFHTGDYTALEASADANEQIVAFARALGDEEALVVAPRLLAKRLRDPNLLPLGEAAWDHALLILPNAEVGYRYRNIFTDEIVTAIAKDQLVGLPLAEVFANFPVALLERVKG